MPLILAIPSGTPPLPRPASASRPSFWSVERSSRLAYRENRVFGRDRSYVTSAVVIARVPVVSSGSRINERP
jgi:hypothetical protein